MSKSKDPAGGEQRLSPAEAQALIKAIEDIEREEAAKEGTAAEPRSEC